MSASVANEEIKTYKKAPILISLLIAGFFGLYFETSMNIALGTLMDYFNVGQSTIQWVTTAYLLTLGILVPVSALLFQWFTTRQLFIGAVLCSIIGAVIAALSPTFTILLIARIIQAVGIAIFLPLMINTILIIFPVEKRGSAMGLVGLVMMFAPSIGPTLAGVIMVDLSWHWIFWVALPFLIFTLIFGIIYLPNITEVTKPKIDILSIILSTLGFGGVVYGFSSAGEKGWESSIVLISIIVGIIALILFYVRQLKLKEPMIDMRVLKYPMYTLGLLTVFIVFMTIMGTMIVLPLYLQIAIGLTTAATGFVLLPGALANGIASPFIGRLFDQFGPRVLIIPAFVVIMGALFSLSNLSTTTSTGMIILLTILLLVSCSLAMTPAQTNALNQLPRDLYASGNALMTTLQQVAGAVGSAIYMTIVSTSQNKYLANSETPEDPATLAEAFVSGTQSTFQVSLIIAIIGFIIALFIRANKKVKSA